MNNADLIQQLVKDLKPVRTLAPLWQRVSLYLLATIGVALIEMFVIAKIHPEVYLAFRNSPMFLIETLLILGTPVIAAVGALVLSVPGNENKQWLQYSAVAVFLLFIGMNLYNIFDPIFPNSIKGHNDYCMLDIISLGFIPAILLFLIVRKAAPLNWKWLSGLITLGAYAPLVAVQQVTCMASGPHVLLAHITPVLLMSVAIYYLGRKFI